LLAFLLACLRLTGDLAPRPEPPDRHPSAPIRAAFRAHLIARCPARRDEASSWFYDKELQRNRAPRRVFSGAAAALTRRVRLQMIKIVDRVEP
jgi:hypothetical protein